VPSALVAKTTTSFRKKMKQLAQVNQTAIIVKYRHGIQGHPDMEALQQQGEETTGVNQTCFIQCH